MRTRVVALDSMQRLGIGVDGHKLDALQAFIDHAVDGIAAAAAHAHHFDAGKGFDLVGYWIDVCRHWFLLHKINNFDLMHRDFLQLISILAVQ